MVMGLRLIWAIVTAVVVLTVATGPAAAQADDPGPATAPGTVEDPEATETTLRPAPGGLNNVLGPRPGEEVPPRSAGDRGGWLQLTLLAALVGGLAVIGTLVVRDARRNRDRAGIDAVH